MSEQEWQDAYAMRNEECERLQAELNEYRALEFKGSLDELHTKQAKSGLKNIELFNKCHQQAERINNLESGLCIQEYEDERAQQAEQITAKDKEIDRKHRIIIELNQRIENGMAHAREQDTRIDWLGRENQRLKELVNKSMCFTEDQVQTYLRKGNSDE